MLGTQADRVVHHVAAARQVMLDFTPQPRALQLREGG